MSDLSSTGATSPSRYYSFRQRDELAWQLIVASVSRARPFDPRDPVQEAYEVVDAFLGTK